MWLITLGLGIFASATAVAQPVVTILDPGAEPRTPLRYQFREGATESMVMDMGIRMSMSVGGQQMPAPGMPEIRMLMNLETTELRDDGTARIEYQIRSAGAADSADPATAAALGGALGQLGGASGWALIDARGATLGTGVNLSDNVDPELAQVMESAEQSMQQISAPLPADPVGIGARWEVSSDVQSQGFTVSQTATYTLTAFDGDSAEVDIKMTQTAPPQLVEAPGMPPGTEASLESLESTGTGTMQIEFARLVPRSEISLAMAMAMSIAMQGQTMQIGMDMQMDTSMMPAGAAQ
jgi:hypothetical protein